MLNIDLISVNCTDAYASVAALKYSSKFFKFGRKILITHEDVKDEEIEVIKIDKLNSVDEYNDFILKLNNYVNNDFVIVLQDDGHIINPLKWTDEFLNFDYIGAPWPSHIDENWISLQKKDRQEILKKTLSKNRVGNGGFSLRSKKFLEYSAQFDSCEGWGEDAFLCIQNYDKAIQHGIKFPPVETALRFSYENPFDSTKNIRLEQGFFDVNNHFGWHGRNFINTQQLLSVKYT